MATREILIDITSHLKKTKKNRKLLTILIYVQNYLQSDIYFQEKWITGAVITASIVGPMTWIMLYQDDYIEASKNL